MSIEAIEDLLAQHRPSEWHWSCACGEMQPADPRTHAAKHRRHLAERVAAFVGASKTGLTRG